MLLSDRDVCLSVAYIGSNSRTERERERPRKTKIGTEVAHLTCDSDTTFNVKGQGHQAALLTAVLARQAAAAVGVRTYWSWEAAATLPSARRRKSLRHPQGERGGGTPWRPPTYSLFVKKNCTMYFIPIAHALLILLLFLLYAD